MQITVNGEPKDVANDINLFDLILELGIKPEMIAVQHNEDIVDRKRFRQITLREDDVVELIRIVGGG
jgi:thiamine biosynthesis protein ThiS